MMTASQQLPEALSDYAGYYIQGATLLEQGQSEYQCYEVWESPLFGKLFRLDHCFMTSEKDEFFYHENLIHVSGCAHGNLRRVLIIGGGDGGSAEELLKYPSVEQITVVELDAKVVEIAKKYLCSVHKGAFDDPRVALHFADGLDFVARAAPAQYDQIVLDLTDPVGPAEALYSESFFMQCKTLLRDRGVLSLHIGAPFYQPERVRDQIVRLRRVFKQVAPYFMYIPLYGSQWGMACASETLNPSVCDTALIDRRIRELGLTDLKHYNGCCHHAQFQLPNYLQKLLF